MRTNLLTQNIAITHSGAGMVAWAASVVVLTVFSAGCSNLRIHNEVQAKLAQETKEQYVKADLPGIFEGESKNLDFLLAESIKVVRDNHKLSLDFALLGIAADEAPMSKIFEEIYRRAINLGMAESGGDRADIHKLHEFVKGAGEHSLRTGELNQWAATLRKIGRATAPPCSANNPVPAFDAWLTANKIVDENVQARLKLPFSLYTSACDKAKKAIKSATGAIGNVRTKIDHERSALKARQDASGKGSPAATALETARADYAKAMSSSDAAAKACADQRSDVKELIGRFHEKLKTVVDAANEKSFAIAGDTQLKSLLTLLEAAAGGPIGTLDGETKKAALIAHELPGLGEDVCALLVAQKAPPVGNLLLALRHKTLEREHEQELSALADRRIALLQDQEGLLSKEAEQWLLLHNALCSFAMTSDPSKPYYGDGCLTFSYDGQGDAIVCKTKELTIAKKCPLGQSWALSLYSAADGAPKRELYKALLAYQRALMFRARASEIDFKLVDAYHRQTLAMRQVSVRQWNNLVSGPIAQLEAYFNAGLKPAEIADLIVKALGLTAIAIGVSK